MFWSLLCTFIGVFLIVFGILFAEGWVSIILGALMIAFGGFLMLGSILIKKSPILTRYTKVHAKTTNISDEDDGTTSYVITFEFNNRRVNVVVDESLYNSVEEGDIGLLDYKDIAGRFNYLGFKRD